MTDIPGPEPLDFGGPDEGKLTDAEKLAALGTYIKVLTAMEKQLRTAVEKDMGARRVEKVGAYLPNGTKIASVSRSDGNRTVQYDQVKALNWCRSRYPDEVETVERVRPAFLKKLLDVAGSLPAGSKGLDPATGEELAFITVEQGNPYVSISTTDEGVSTMTALAHGFARMLEQPTAAAQ
jgi:2-oxoglutarate dehydrogenase complex dehydrogenase (E1) component-like enzyme